MVLCHASLQIFIFLNVIFMRYTHVLHVGLVKYLLLLKLYIYYYSIEVLWDIYILMSEDTTISYYYLNADIILYSLILLCWIFSWFTIIYNYGLQLFIIIMLLLIFSYKAVFLLYWLATSFSWIIKLSHLSLFCVL